LNLARTLFYRYWPIVVGLITFILFGVWLDAQDRPACLVKTHEEICLDFQGRTKQQYIVIEAGTSEQQLSPYEIVLGPKGEIKWKELWKLRSKAEMTCEEYLEFKEKQTKRLAKESPALKGGETTLTER